jgi:hypothetical protein
MDNTNKQLSDAEKATIIMLLAQHEENKKFMKQYIPKRKKI